MTSITVVVLPPLSGHNSARARYGMPYHPGRSMLIWGREKSRRMNFPNPGTALINKGCQHPGFRQSYAEEYYQAMAAKPRRNPSQEWAQVSGDSSSRSQSISPEPSLGFSRFAVGVFTSFLPLPGQMVIAALLALWLRCNLPLSIILVWISNPITMPAIFYSTYKLGAWILGTPGGL